MENSSQAKEYIGRHFIVEFYDCVEESLTDPIKIETALAQAAVLSGATILNSFSHNIPKTGGVSTVVAIQETYAAVDLYTCGKHSNPRIGLEYLREFFQPKYEHFSEYQRGDIDKMPQIQSTEYEQCSPEGKEINWWFKDLVDSSGIGTSLKMKGDPLYKQKTQFQWVNVYQSTNFGKVLVLDGVPQLSDVDEPFYHEMFVHVPMFAHPDPRKILIIGGGDGGVAREVLKHENVEKLVQVEIDEEVVKVCKKFFPQLACAYGNDSRFELIIGDGIKYVAETADESFDIVIVDSTDPGGPSVPLFSAQFYQDVKRILKTNGLVISQAESPIGYPPEVVRSIFTSLRQIYGQNVYCYYVNVPVFTGGQTFSFSSKSGTHPYKDINEEKIEQFCNKHQLVYYSTEMHRASFVVPRYIKKIIFSEQLITINFNLKLYALFLLLYYTSFKDSINNQIVSNTLSSRTEIFFKKSYQLLQQSKTKRVNNCTYLLSIVGFFGQIVEMKFILGFVFLIQAIVIKSESRIRAVLQYSRHGARYSVSQSKFNHIFNKSLQNLQELTPAGMRQHYILGLEMKNRYFHQLNLIPEFYDPRKIEVYCSDISRTYMSAQSQLLGIYPEANDRSKPPIHVYNVDQYISELNQYSLPHNLQPIPVHSNKEYNQIIAGWKNCPVLDHIKQSFKQTNDYKYKVKEYEDTLQIPLMEQMNSTEDIDIYEAIHILSLIEIHLIHGWELNLNISDIPIQDLIKLRN